jgi:serine/threonine-protein kinase
MYKAPTPLREAVPRPEDLSPGLEAVVMKCLAKRAENRYQSMEELKVDIDRLIAGTVPQVNSQRGDLMASPATYYEVGQPSSSGVAPKKSRTFVAAVVGALALVAIVGGVLKLQAPATTATAETGTRPEVRPVEAVAVVPPQATPVIALRQVTIATEPLDAHIFQDGKDLGQAPVNVEVPEGKNVELQIVREGYKNARVVLDGSEGTQAIKLEKVAVAPRPSKAPKPQTAQPKPAATKKRPSLGSGEIIDPWSK